MPRRSPGPQRTSPESTGMPRARKDEFIARFESLILSGRFAPGDQLPAERELAESLGASRPVVHAALNELSQRGLVRIEPRRGVFVADWRREGSVEMLLSLMSYAGGDLSPRLFDSLLELRLLFETETARLAARRRTPAQLDALEKVLAKERLLEPREARDVALLDYEFHHDIALASGNDVFPLLMNSLKRIYLQILDRFYVDFTVLPVVFGLHRDLVAEIAAGRGEGAAQAMRNILEYGERTLRRALGSRGAARGAEDGSAEDGGAENGGAEDGTGGSA